MSRPPLAGCLVLCLLSFAPAATARADHGESSPRRRAEIEALIARRHTQNERRAYYASLREAEMYRRLTEERNYEIQLAQSVAAYQQSVERQAMTQAAMLERSNRSSQSYWAPTAATAWIGNSSYSSYSSSTVAVNYAPAAQASEPSHESPANSVGSPHQEVHAAATHHYEPWVHHGWVGQP